MIIFDTETTGIPSSIGTPLIRQPHIIEFAAIKLDDKTMKEIDRLEFLCCPEQPLTPFITRLTGITNEDVKDKPVFASYYPALVRFFKGEKTLVAHNMAFDMKMLTIELQRIGISAFDDFPMPEKKLCSMISSKYINGKWMKLAHLYEHLTGDKFKEAHRAMKDTEALTECVKILRMKNKL